MRVVVVTPPQPIVTPADIPGTHDAGDAAVAAMIAAATEVIDGPSGWLGRSLGPQTLEYSGWFSCTRVRLPYSPIIKIESVVAVDSDGSEETVDPETYRLDSDEIVISAGAAWVFREKHRIRYKAGYNGTTGAAAGEVQTGPVPERVKRAIILSVIGMMRLSVQERIVRSETVDGVGSTSYLDDDRIVAAVQAEAERLLSGLRVYL